MSDLGASTWSETDASNTTAPPAGWPEGMNPGDVNNSARAMMGAEKRFWNRTNSVKTTAGTSTAYTLTYDVAASAYYDGEEFSFVVDETCGADPTLNINSLGARNLRKLGTTGWGNLVAGDVVANQVVRVRYNNADSKFDVIGVAPNALGGNGVRSYLSGLVTSNSSGSPNTVIDVAAGVWTEAGSSQLFANAAGSIDCGTTGANGLDTGSLANSTWYHAFAIGKTDGATAFLASTSASSPTMPSGYTLKRRISSFKTDGSAQIIAFVQDGDLFQWAAPVLDVNAGNPGISAVTRPVSVPTGVNVQAHLQLMISNAGTGNGVFSYFSDLATTDTAPSLTCSDLSVAANIGGFVSFAAAPKWIRTDTSAQIRSRVSFSDANVAVIIRTLGWIDRRGRDA